jgi:hypothetical protein
MRYIPLLGGWALLLFGIWWFALRVPAAPAAAAGAGSETPEPVATGVTDPSAAAQDLPRPMSADERSRGPRPTQPVPASAAQPPAPAPSTGPEPVEREDGEQPLSPSDPREPAVDELSGPLAGLYQRWSRGRVDRENTTAAERYFASMFSEKAIEPDAQDVSCADGVCRARFAFENLDAMRSLAKLPRDREIEIQYGRPQPTSAGTSVVFYFAPKGQSLPQTETTAPADRP